MQIQHRVNLEEIPLMDSCYAKQHRVSHKTDLKRGLKRQAYHARTMSLKP